jgi:hypothetical protein
MSEPKRRIVSLYWDNIDPKMVAAQARVFRHLGYEIEQTCRTGLEHGVFLDEVMAGLGEDDLLLTVDIDCFPTNAAIVERAFAAAASGGLLGCSQVANHIDPTRIFTAPMFLALSRRTWDRLGRPSFRADAEGDVAQRVHDVAVAQGLKVEHLAPWACVIPKWNMAGVILFGIGTFYRGGVFHLYESRVQSPYAFILHTVADDVVAGRETDVLALTRRAMTLYPFEPLITKWRKLSRPARRRPRVDA